MTNKNFIILPYGKSKKREGTKFIQEIKGSERILFKQDGHIVTTERVVEIPKDNT